MPKIKTRKIAAKKFRVSASGCVKRGQCGTSHNTGKKRPSRKRRLRQMETLHRYSETQILRTMPYALKKGN